MLRVVSCQPEPNQTELRWISGELVASDQYPACTAPATGYTLVSLQPLQSVHTKIFTTSIFVLLYLFLVQSYSESLNKNSFHGLRRDSIILLRLQKALLYSDRYLPHQKSKTFLNERVSREINICKKQNFSSESNPQI